MIELRNHPNIAPKKMESNFGRERTTRRIEEILDATKHRNKESLIQELEMFLQKKYSPQVRVQIVKKGPPKKSTTQERYFDITNREELLLNEEEKRAISLSRYKGKKGGIGLYITLQDIRFPSGENDSIIRICGIDNPSLQEEILQGMRYFKQRFVKTSTAIEVQNQDPLTGLFNRYFLERYALERDEKGDKTYAIVFIDLVDLKGHNNVDYSIGDGVLKKFAEILKKKFPRKSDIVSRVGGDEFCVILEFPRDTPIEEQRKLIGDRMEEVQKVLEKGKNNTGEFIINGVPREISILWGSALKNDSVYFWEAYDIAGRRSKHDKTLDGVAARALEGAGEFRPTTSSLFTLARAIQVGMKGLDDYGKMVVQEEIKSRILGEG